MLENLLDITRVDFEDYGSLYLTAADLDGDVLRLTLDISADEHPEIPQNWEVLCSGIREHCLTFGMHNRLEFFDKHVLLWPHLERHISTSFYGQAENPLAVYGALYQRHHELAGDWLPFHRFLNSSMGLLELISGGYGMLAEGPAPLVLAYEEVMSAHGFSTAHREPATPAYGGGSWLELETKAFVLILDDSYVVAEQFVASHF